MGYNCRSNSEKFRSTLVSQFCRTIFQIFVKLRYDSSDVAIMRLTSPGVPINTQIKATRAMKIFLLKMAMLLKSEMISEDDIIRYDRVNYLDNPIKNPKPVCPDCKKIN
ncbi:unnamed protein product [Dovyalis caffra]|uniref:Uncharacterized protein n=1 Tax=Dovyalis caffra TaxID=77055 RepID=A0AAV1QVZ8_9ROSI|nr:unnamed protein product [Dovyalis caffra]